MKKKIAITIDEEIYSKLSELADKEDRTISGQINKLLKYLRFVSILFLSVLYDFTVKHFTALFTISFTGKLFISTPQSSTISCNKIVEIILSSQIPKATA